MKLMMLLFFIGGHFVEGAWSFKSTDRPELPQLQNFVKSDGKSVNLLDSIGADYASFGTCLLDDDDGHKIKNIESDHRSVSDKVRTIITTWFKGSGKRPETWATFASCLRDVGLSTFADMIAMKYEDKDSRNGRDLNSGGIRKTNPQAEPGDKNVIESIQELLTAVEEIGNWRGLCTNLEVNAETMNMLKYSTERPEIKKQECLQAYIDSGKAKWSEVVRAVAKSPINNNRVAKNIATSRGVGTKDEL